MKKIYLCFISFLFTYASFATGEQVWVSTNTGGSSFAKSPSILGFVDPCISLLFYVDVHIPFADGYVIVGKYEWFVNGVSVLTNTSDPSDATLPWNLISKTTSVYCKVTYKKQNGDLSTAYTSTTFTPNIKDLNFPQTISTSTPSPNYGCTANTVSYSLNPGSCPLCYNVGQYNITWQPPAGWVQTSISANGSEVSFTPDATSSGCNRDYKFALRIYGNKGN